MVRNGPEGTLRINGHTTDGIQQLSRTLTSCVVLTRLHVLAPTTYSLRWGREDQCR